MDLLAAVLLVEQDEVEGYVLLLTLPMVALSGVSAASLRFDGVWRTKDNTNPLMVRIAVSGVVMCT